VRARVSGHSIMRRLASPRTPGRTFEGGCAGPLLRSRPAPRGKSRPRGRGAPTDPPRGRVRPSSHPTPVAGKFSQRPSGRLSALNPPPVQVAEGQVDVRERALTGAAVARPKTNHLSGSRVPEQALRNGFHRRTLTETVELVSEDSPRDIAGVCRIWSVRNDDSPRPVAEMDSIAPGAVYAPRRDGGPITRDELIERIAQVSHATWLVQGVDGGRTLADPYSSGPPGYKGTEEWQADLAEAERMLKAVLDGGRLEDLSSKRSRARLSTASIVARWDSNSSTRRRLLLRASCAPVSASLHPSQAVYSRLTKCSSETPEPPRLHAFGFPRRVEGRGLARPS
jgi:hypothetical protein